MRGQGGLEHPHSLLTRGWRGQGQVGDAIHHCCRDRLPRGNRLQPMGAVMKVFWPYITFDTVFDNTRVTSELELPAPSFTDYGAALFEFATRNRFSYPYLPFPDQREAA